MANNDDKDIVITPNSGQSGYPNISFKGYNADTDGDSITMNVLDDNTLSFESDEGQVFSIGPVLSSGTIFSVNDISGVPSITVDADGTITLAPYEDGNVGIGTSSPDSALEIMNGTLKITREETENSVVTEDDVKLDVSNGLKWTFSQSFDNPNPVPIGTTTDNDVRIIRYNQTHQYFYWDRTYFSKKVGIGTTTIDAPLHVQSASDLLSIFESTDANAGIQIDSPNDGYSVVFFAEGGTNKWSLGKLANNSDKFSIYDEVNTTPRLVIDTSGNIGIGTDSPDGPLHIYHTDNTGVPALTIETDATDSPSDSILRIKESHGSDTYIDFTVNTFGQLEITGGAATRRQILTADDPDTDSSGIISLNKDHYAWDTQIFGDSSTPVIFVDGTNNRVGIGTTSPSEALDVVGDITTSAHLNARRVNIEETSGYGSMEMGGPSGAFLDMKNPFSDDFDARLITDGNGLDIIMSGAGRDIRLMTNGTERFKVEDALVTSSVGLTVNGSITVADNIIHSGDTNNTISFGTDTQSFNTGSTARMNISDSGLQVGTGARVTTILDEDNMASNSATALATQQSIKAYVDANSGGGGSTSPAGSDSQVQYNNGGSFGGDADFTWDDTNNRLVIGSVTSQHDGLGKLTVKGTDASFLLEKHDDSASGGPTMTLYRYSSSVADGDLIGQINFRGEGSTGNPSTYISLRTEIVDTTEGTKDAKLIMRGLQGNSQTEFMHVGQKVQIGPESVNPSGITTGKVTISRDSTDETTDGPTLMLVDGDDDSSPGPVIKLYRNTASPADNDVIGQILFSGEDSVGGERTYGSISARTLDVTSGTRDSEILLKSTKDGVDVTTLTLYRGEVKTNLHVETYKPVVYMDTGTQNVNQTEATLGFNSEVLDPASNASSTTDGHIRLAAGGYYRISYSIPINDDGSTGGDRTRVFTFMQVDDNNSFTSPTTVAQSRAQVYTRESSGGSGLSSSFIYQHTANDYIRLRIDAEGTTDISTESNQSQISIEYLGPA